LPAIQYWKVIDFQPADPYFTLTVAEEADTADKEIVLKSLLRQLPAGGRGKATGSTADMHPGNADKTTGSTDISSGSANPSSGSADRPPGSADRPPGSADRPPGSADTSSGGADTSSGSAYNALKQAIAGWSIRGNSEYRVYPVSGWVTIVRSTRTMQVSQLHEEDQFEIILME
jgi:hypothetical protein